MPVLYCHLGDFRTGSTAIQSVLSQQAGRFGLYWPKGPNHVGLAQSLADPGQRADAWSALAREVAGQDRVLISAEHFEFADPAHLAEALAQHLPGHEVRLIAYVRPHGPALLARFAESVKIGNFDGTPQSYLDWPQTRWRLSYAPRFGRWRAAFGAAFTLRLYDRAGFPGGSVLRDLLLWTNGADPGALTVPDGNPTPGVGDLALALAWHRAMGDLPAEARAAQWTLGRQLGRLLAAAPRDDSPLRVDQALYKRISQKFAGDAAALDAEFFAPDTPMTAALARLEEAAPAEAQSLDPADHLSPDALRLLRAWGQMLGQGLRTPGGADMLMRLYHE